MQRWSRPKGAAARRGYNIVVPVSAAPKPQFPRRSRARGQRQQLQRLWAVSAVSSTTTPPHITRIRGEYGCGMQHFQGWCALSMSPRVVERALIPWASQRRAQLAARRACLRDVEMFLHRQSPRGLSSCAIQVCACNATAALRAARGGLAVAVHKHNHPPPTERPWRLQSRQLGQQIFLAAPS